MDYDFNFDPSILGSLDYTDVLLMLLPTMILSFIFTFGIYLIGAIGLYKMAKNRGYKNAWLAFIPVANSFVKGGIADNINACCQKKSHFRYSLLALSIINTLLGTLTTIFMATKLLDIISMATYGFFDEHFVFGMLSQTLGLAGFEMLIVIALAVIDYIVLYKIFADYSNNNGVLFLILSILFGIGSFFILGLCNKPSRSIYFMRNGINPNMNNRNNPYNQQYNPQYNQYNQYNQPYNPQYNQQNQPYNPQYNQQNGQPYNPQYNPQNGQPIQQPIQPPIQPQYNNQYNSTYPQQPVQSVQPTQQPPMPPMQPMPPMPPIESAEQAESKNDEKDI